MYLHEDYINSMVLRALFPADIDAVASKILSKFTEEFYQKSFLVISIYLWILKL